MFPPITSAGDSTAENQQTLKIKADAVVEAFIHMGYDAITLGDDDLQLGMKTALNIIKAQKLPLVCANLLDLQTQEPIFSPYIMKNVGHLKIGIFGLIPSDGMSKGLSSDIVLKDPIETARKISADLKTKVDIIILLSSLGHDKNAEIAEKVEGIHIILGGDKNGGRTYSKMSYKPLLIHTGHEGWYLRQLEFVINDPARPFIDDGLTMKIINQKLTRIQTHLSTLEKRSAKGEATSKTREDLLRQKQEAVKILENYDSYNQISSKIILLDDHIADDKDCHEILFKYLKRLDRR
ncbi:MAG: hypothetical protein JW932_06800 [Deltaproteobacteria bacterium]|nr:hypothetical protein [Deltaproteobacteria bacterium]